MKLDAGSGEQDGNNTSEMLYPQLQQSKLKLIEKIVKIQDTDFQNSTCCALTLF